MSQKAYIPLENLSIIYDEDYGYSYYSRYRVTSSDKNRTSEWSPLYRIQAPRAFPLSTETPALIVRESPIAPTVSIGPEEDYDVINLYWTPPAEIANVGEFDVFVKYGLSWSYLNTQRQGTISVIDDGTSGVLSEISVHIPSYPKTVRLDGADLNRHLEVFSVDVSPPV
jgi:hypothetical protein